MTSINQPSEENNLTEDSPLLKLPQEIILHILSYLDIFDLDCLAGLTPFLGLLSSDLVLHRNRLRVVAPSRIAHSLFAEGCHGTLLRPSIADLVRMNVMRGIGIERRWRLGIYFHSSQSVKLYESCLRLEHARVVRVLSNHLTNWMPHPKQAASLDRVILPPETNSPLISRRLLPVIARLKWSMKRDGLARRVRGSSVRGSDEPRWWIEGSGRMLIHEGERIRLAVCPGVRKFVNFFEQLSTSEGQYTA